MFQNLSQLKKFLKVGQKVHTIHHQNLNFWVGRSEDNKIVLFGDKDMGKRTVTKVVSTYCEIDGSRCDYPKANDCEFINGNQLIIYEDDWRTGKTGKIKLLTYTFLQ